MDQASLMQMAQMLQSQGGAPPQGGLSELMRQNFAARGPGPIMENNNAAPPQMPQRPNDPLAPAYQGAADAMVQYGAGAAAPAAGAGLAALMRAAPKLTTMGLGGLAALAPTQMGEAEAAKAGPVNPESPIVQIQTKLKLDGLYNGPVDGIMGPATEQAIAKSRAMEQERASQGIASTQATAELEKAKAASLETERLRTAAEQDAARKIQGDQRLMEAENNVSPISRFLRDHGSAAGLALGGALGLGSRYGVVKGADAASAAAAARANRVMTPPGPDPASRVGQVNQFWGEGQQVPMRGAPQAPFVAAPNTPRAFAANPDAPPSTALYQPNRVKNALTDAAIPAAGLAEAGISDQVLGSRARDDLKAAQDALAKDPSEANIQRQQAALDAVAMAQGVSNLGRGVAGGYIAGMPKMGRNPTRPDVAGAEGERIRLDQFLRTGRNVPPPGANAAQRGVAPPSPSTQQGAPQPHPEHSNRDVLGRFRTSE